MRILNLFGGYFLVLIIIQGLVLSTFDARSLKKAGMERASKKAKVIGRGIVLVGIILFTINTLIL